MSAMIYDPMSQAFVEAETPMKFDTGNQSWTDTTGLAYNPEVEAWEEKWNIIVDMIDANNWIVEELKEKNGAGSFSHSFSENSIIVNMNKTSSGSYSAIYTCLTYKDEIKGKKSITIEFEASASPYMQFFIDIGEERILYILNVSGKYSETIDISGKSGKLKIVPFAPSDSSGSSVFKITKLIMK